MKILIIALLLNLLSHFFMVRFLAFHRKMNNQGEEAENFHQKIAIVLLIPPLAFVVAISLITLGFFIKDKKS
jgi:hypothetical protein